YPPGMLLLWWPVARWWTLSVGPLSQSFAAPSAFTALPIPAPLAAGMKLPVILADLANALMLARLAGPRLGRWYLFNPYVLLVGLWSFEAVSLAFLLCALLAAEHRRWAAAGLLLGLGAAIKLLPAVCLPAIAAYALRTDRSAIRAAAITVVVAVAAFVVICMPWRDGVLYVIDFHA